MYLKAATIISLLSAQSSAFVQNTHVRSSLLTRQEKSRRLDAKKPNKSSPRGFGKPASGFETKADPMERTYDIIPTIPTDEQAAMQDFFGAYADWHPLFASISSNDDVPASSHIDLTIEKSIEFDDETPWKKLSQLPIGPQKDDHMKVISHVLDNFQTALTDIPVSQELYSRDVDDNNDTHFIEEGRRLLVLERFHVISGVGEDNHDLFRTCWSEIHHLVSEKSSDTGSLIILEEFDHEQMDLAQFVDTNIRMPLQFLGLAERVEVASFERGKNCVRLIHQLGAMPSLEQRDSDLEQSDSESDDFQ
jgi:hypothetical protein|eukprot:scaffold193_cov239-Chaetoceros_neogracile.AAC.2